MTVERGESCAKAAARSLCPWAELMRRVFAIDVLECPRCQRPMKILAQIHPPDTTRKILQCLGLPARPPPIAMARPDPQESLPFDSDEAARLD